MLYNTVRTQVNGPYARYNNPEISLVEEGGRKTHKKLHPGGQTKKRGGALDLTKTGSSNAPA